MWGVKDGCGDVSGKKRNEEQCLCRWKSPADHVYIYVGVETRAKTKKKLGGPLVSEVPIHLKANSRVTKNFPAVQGKKELPRH